MSQLIDIEAVKEFMAETLDKSDKKQLIEIADALELKSLMFQEKFKKENIGKIFENEIREILGSVFAAKRKVGIILEKMPLKTFRQNLSELLYGKSEIEYRFQNFTDQLGDLNDNLKHDLTGELLHFTFPDKYWLWGRWMWDKKNKTGALPLVTTEGFDLEGSNLGETYMKVGNGVAFVHTVAEAGEFQFINRSLFGTDVFLSCVYVIYAYTVLRMRMTQEFNNVMPGLEEFSRRILGVNNVPVTTEN